MPSYLTKDEVRLLLREDLKFTPATVEAWLAGFSGGQMFRPGNYLRQFVSYLGELDEHKSDLKYFFDRQRHLVCVPYSKANLHRMAGELGIGRHWFHGDHYDIPLRRQREIQARCKLVRPNLIIRIISGYSERELVRGKQQTKRKT